MAQRLLRQIRVAPFVGAWIEIFDDMAEASEETASLRSSERGLKYRRLIYCASPGLSLRSSERGLKLCA